MGLDTRYYYISINTQKQQDVCLIDAIRKWNKDGILDPKFLYFTNRVRVLSIKLLKLTQI